MYTFDSIFDSKHSHIQTVDWFFFQLVWHILCELFVQ